MRDNKATRSDGIARSSLFAAVGAGVLASICCVGPLAAVAVGVGGAWVGQLSALEPYRPLFIALALGALAFAWYREVRPRQDPDCACETGPSLKTRRLLLGVGTVQVLGLLAAPEFIGRSHAATMSNEVVNVATQEVTLEVQGMTCEACSQAVVYALQRLEGVQDAIVTLEPPEARVRFNPEKVSVAQLIEAVRSAGFEASLKTEPSS